MLSACPARATTSGFMHAVLGPCRVILRHRPFRELLLCLVLLGLSSSFVLPFFSLFATREVGMSPWLFSGFLVATSLCAVMVATLLARWSDVWLSRRFVLALSCLGGACGYAGYAFVRDVGALFLIGCLVLSLAGVTFSQMFAYARELIVREGLPANETPLYINVFRLMYALAWTVGPGLASWTMTHAGFRGTFLATSGLFLFLFFYVLRVVRPTPVVKHATTREGTPFWKTLRRPGIPAHFSGFTLLFCAATMTMLNLPLYVIDALHGSERDVGVIYSISPAFEIPLMLYFGLLASKGHQNGLIRAGALIAVVYYGSLTLVGAPWHIFPLQIMAAALVSITSGIAITFFQDYLPDQPGTATNLFSSASRIGSMLGYVLFGALSGELGHRGLFVVCTALSAVTTLLFFLRRQHRAPRLQPIPG